MPIVKASAKGQVVIPGALRARIGLGPGDSVQVTYAGDRKILIEPIPEDPIEAAYGMLQGDDSLTEALIRERKDDDDRERAKAARLLRDSGLSEQGGGR